MALENERDPEILRVPMELIFPHGPQAPDSSKNLCEATDQTPKEDLLYKGEKSYVKNCSALYPYAGMMNVFEGGYSPRRTKRA